MYFFSLRIVLHAYYLHRMNEGSTFRRRTKPFVFFFRFCQLNLAGHAARAKIVRTCEMWWGDFVHNLLLLPFAGTNDTNALGLPEATLFACNSMRYRYQAHTEKGAKHAAGLLPISIYPFLKAQQSGDRVQSNVLLENLLTINITMKMDVCRRILIRFS